MDCMVGGGSTAIRCGRIEFLGETERGIDAGGDGKARTSRPVFGRRVAHPVNAIIHIGSLDRRRRMRLATS